MTNHDPNTTPASRQFLRVLIRYWWAVVGCAVLAGAVALGISKIQTRSYTASASLLFQQQSPTQQATGLASTAGTNDPVGQRATELILVQQSSTVARRAAAHLRGISVDQVRSAVTATQPGNANVVSVSASWPSGAGAARIANAYANAFVTQEQFNNESSVQSAINLVQGQLNLLPISQRGGTAASNLRNQLESLRILKSMQGDVRVIQPAVAPSTPSSPRVTRNVVLGIAIGLLIGLLVVARLGRADRHIRDAQEAQSAFDLPLLGVIPHSPSRGLDGHEPTLEAFRMLRGYLRYFNVDYDNRLLLVTSAEAAEGKTTVARGLAIAAAQMGTRTLLLEADLRRPSLAEKFGWAPSTGLTDVLLGITDQDPERSILRADAGDPLPSFTGERDNRHHLDVMLAGAQPPNPAALLESNAMASLLTWAAAQYELVVVDSAPLLAVSDSLPLLERVNGTIIVARLGRTSFETAELLRQRLDSVGASVIGTVVNDQRAAAQSSYVYSYSGRASHEAERFPN